MLVRCGDYGKKFNEKCYIESYLYVESQNT